MLVQIHILQNYAPANLNRDDTGSPKDAMFGGFRRGRISSQCLKRSIRKSTIFEATFKAEGLLGERTKQLPELIGKELRALGADDKVISAITERVPQIGRKADKSGEAGEDDTAEKAEAESVTKQLIFLGRNEIRPLAETLLKLYQKDPQKWAKIELEKELSSSLPRSVDVALFGRMTTSAAFEDVQAACQVAHAISTNALAQEFDYYTAVDDLSGESGAGMIGDVEFNSSTYYKYINVHWEALVKNLGNDIEIARQAVIALVEAAATAQPSGKQNSFAAHNLPDLVMVEVSEKNLPVNYANAFLKPARPGGDQSLVDASVQKLAEYLGKVDAKFSLVHKRAFVALEDYTIPGAKVIDSLPLLQEWLGAQLG